MSLSKQLIALVLTIKNKETKHHIHQKHKTETEKTTRANRTIYTLIWYNLLRPPTMKWSGPYSYSPGAHMGLSQFNVFPANTLLNDSKMLFEYFQY